MLNRILYLLLFVISGHGGMARSMRGADAVWDNDLKSVQLRKMGMPLAEPVIALGSGEQTLLTFDDLSTLQRRLLYRISLCNADWHISDLPIPEYISGFQEDNIDAYTQSFGTLTPYTHYELRLPNENTTLLLSGNYLVQIIDSDYPDAVLLQKGFMVVEHGLPLVPHCNINLIPAGGRGQCQQQLDIKVDYHAMNIQNPRQDIIVRVTQNGFYPNTAPIEAVYVDGAYVDYAFHDKNLYDGGAEYRQFDISSVEYLSLRVQRLEVVEGRYHAMLAPDGMQRQHFSYIDNNGKYTIHNLRYPQQSSAESDYVMTYFCLHSPKRIDGSIYLFGELTNWELAPLYELHYDPSTSAYTAALPLKQGIYDYRYLLLTPSGEPDLAAIEYCSAQTENTYGIYIYYRGMTDRHDRLAAALYVSTKQI
jgi:hypothetical protein